jgi:hypothetical protein
MLWEEPLLAALQEHRMEGVGRARRLCLVADALFARRPEAADTTQTAIRSLCTCGGCGRAYRVLKIVSTASALLQPAALAEGSGLF